MTAKPDLRSMRWELTHHATIQAPRGSIDNWLLHDPKGRPEDIIGLTVPEGRTDIADFVVRCLKAGQALLNDMTPGVRFRPDEANRRRAH